MKIFFSLEIIQSLDKAPKNLSDTFKRKLFEPVVDVVAERLASCAATAFCSAAVASVVVACHHLHLASSSAVAVVVGPDPAFPDSFHPCSEQTPN